MQRAMALVRERPALVGAAWLFVAVNVGNVLAYAYQVAMLRLLQPQEFALLVSLFAALIIESQGITLLQNTAAKVVAHGRAIGDMRGVSAFAWSWGVRVAIVVGAIAVAIALGAPLLAPAFGFPPVTVVMLAASLLFAALFAFAAGVLQGLARFGWLGGAYISQAGARLLLGVVLVVAGFGVAGAFGGATVAVAFSFLVTVAALRGEIRRPRPGEQAPPAGAVFAGAAVLLLFYALLVNVDALLAPALLPPADAGAYAAAVTMGKIALFAPLGLSVFLLERTASAHALARPTRPTLYLVLAAVLAVSGAVALVYLAAPEFAARIVAGEAYAAAVARIVGIYGVAALSNAILQVWAVYFVGIGRLRIAVAFLIAFVTLAGALVLMARDPSTMARTVLAVTLATQVVVTLTFLRTRG
jgi:O-antigen/teichoic acid export membrane protein